MEFYLGTHMPAWLGDPRFADVPLFVSRTSLAVRARTRVPKAVTGWALDSGGYTQLHKHGRWTLTVDEYVDDVQRVTAAGRLQWVAPMDWMCEPSAREATGLDVREHQARTLHNFVELRERLGPLVIPVLQGWEFGDHANHREQYLNAGVDLAAERVVGVGSVCRRDANQDISRILHSIELDNLHGFGLRGESVSDCRHILASADSMAWSYNARRNPPMIGCTHKRCEACPRWALRWREEQIVNRLSQGRLFDG